MEANFLHCRLTSLHWANIEHVALRRHSKLDLLHQPSQIAVLSLVRRLACMGHRLTELFLRLPCSLPDLGPVFLVLTSTVHQDAPCRPARTKR